MGYLEAGWPHHLIQQWLNLTETQIEAAFAYIEEHRAEVDAEYQTVLAQAKAIRTYWEARNQDRLTQVAALPDVPGNEELVARLRAWKSELAHAQ